MLIRIKTMIFILFIEHHIFTTMIFNVYFCEIFHYFVITIENSKKMSNDPSRLEPATTPINTSFHSIIILFFIYKYKQYIDTFELKRPKAALSLLFQTTFQVEEI